MQVAIQAAMNKRAARLELTAERVLHELARIAFANMGEFITITPDGGAVVDLSMLTADQAAAIQEITSEVYLEGPEDAPLPVKRTKLKLHSRSKALHLLGKHLQLFADRHELTGPGGGPIVTLPVPLDELPEEALKAIHDALKARGDA